MGDKALQVEIPIALCIPPALTIQVCHPLVSTGTGSRTPCGYHNPQKLTSLIETGVVLPITCAPAPVPDHLSYLR